MNIVRVYLPNGELIEEYPDAYVFRDTNFFYVFDMVITEEKKNRSTEGNWIACFSPTVVTHEFKQGDPDENC